MDCMNNDTICSEHNAMFHECRHTSTEPSCVMCERSDNMFYAAAEYRNDFCGECFEYCSNKHSHRTYSPTFNYVYECNMDCGEMWYSPIVP